MATNSKTISQYNTTVSEHNGIIRVQFYATVIAMIGTESRTAVFNSGGYHTATTVDRLNSTWAQYIGALRPFGRRDHVICFNGVPLENCITIAYGPWRDVERAGFTPDDSGDAMTAFYARLWAELPVPLTADVSALEAMQARFDAQPIPMPTHA